MKKVLLLLATLFIASELTDSYTLLGHKWQSTKTPPFYVNPTSRYFSTDRALQIAKDAATNWRTQTQADIAATFAGTTAATTVAADGVNNVMFRDEDGGGLSAQTFSWWDGTGQLVDADIVVYEAVYSFVALPDGCNGQIYVDSTLTHEFGHFLGLGHSEVAEATMYPVTHYCDPSLTSLEPDDVTALETLYPVGPPPTTTTTTTTTIPAGPMLGVRPYKVKGVRYADLAWSGLSTLQVDVYRGSLRLRTVQNSGAYTDPVGGKGGGTVTYKVCNFASTTCTNVATATW